MTPITIKLFECLKLNPVPMLPFIILNINIAGLTTLIGHPPNLLITGNSFIAKQNITFFTFTMHMSFGVSIALIQTNFHLYFQHKNIYKILANGASSVDEVIMWQKCLDSVKCSVDIDKLDDLQMILMRKIETIQNESINECGEEANTKQSFETTLRQLKKMVRFLTIQMLEFSKC